MSKKSKKNENKEIAVINTQGKIISYCNKRDAYKLICAERARWDGYNVLFLFKTHNEVVQEKQKIIEDANRTCYICGIKISEEDTATIDHVIPLATHSQYAYKMTNQRCCCVRCNKDKDNKLLSVYVEHITKNKDQYPYITKRKLKELKIFAQQHERNYMIEQIKKISKEQKQRRHNKEDD